MPDALFDTGKIREPLHMRAQYAFQKLAQERDTLNVKELCVAFDQLGFDLSMIDVERLCGGNETKYEDFLAMLESLPAVHEVPSVHRRVRGFVDDSDGERTEVWETASARGEVSSAPSPAERLAALSRQVEAMRRDVARNRDALRAMEAHAASERMAGE